jgi:dihydrosphingosine 1-phosphate phosphatase
MGTHHLEYGFPSTHSTNSISIALYLFAHIYLLTYPPASDIGTDTTSYSSITMTNSTLSSTDITSPITAESLSSPAAAGSEPVLSPDQFFILSGILAWYAFSIVFGRLYTAMHSFTDCVTGVILGTGIWWGYTSFPGIPVTLTLPFALPSSLLSLPIRVFPAATTITATSAGKLITQIPINLFRGLGTGKLVDTWVFSGKGYVPVILIFVMVVAVNQHPQPIDDCPCFEDAIAFGSVGLGAVLGKWVIGRYLSSNGGERLFLNVVMPGSGWAYDSSTHLWTQSPRTLSDVFLWWSMAILKMTFGILVIFVWRIIAKSTLHVILPPIFRVLAKAVELPNRRFYTPATRYKSVPSEFFEVGRDEEGREEVRPRPLKTIPSVIDLPNTLVEDGTGEVDGAGGVGVGSGIDLDRKDTSNKSGVKMRKAAFKNAHRDSVKRGHAGNGHHAKQTSAKEDGHGGAEHEKDHHDGDDGEDADGEGGGGGGEGEGDKVKHYDADGTFRCYTLSSSFAFFFILFPSCNDTGG